MTWRGLRERPWLPTVIKLDTSKNLGESDVN
jgi:hypothetical protein